QRGARCFVGRRCRGAEHGAFPGIDVHQHVGDVHQHFLLIRELLPVGLHRRAEHHQRRLLVTLDGAALLTERRIVGRSHRRRPHQLVLQRPGGRDHREGAFGWAAYLTASPIGPWAPPLHIAPSLNRPKFSTLAATLCPLPPSPSRLPAGTRTSCRITGVVDDPCSPILCSSLPLVTPLNARSTMNAVKCSPSTLPKTMNTSAKPPFVIHIFSPLSTKLPSACLAARVFAPSASDPDPDSLRQYAPTSSPVISFGRYFCFCSSVPKSISGSAQRLACAPNVDPNEAARAIFSLTTIDATLSSASPP